MAKRMTDTDKWKNPFFRRLPHDMKLLWLYILDDCDIAGLWQVDLAIACIRMECEIKEEDAIATFGDHIKVVENGEKWFIPSFLEFQQGTEISRQNNMFKSIDKILTKYNLYQHLTIEIVDEGTTMSAIRGRLSQKMKDKIFLEAEFTCQYCSIQKAKAELVVDHFIPIDSGGNNSDDNLICSCIRCNSHKAHLLPDVFLNKKDHDFLKPTDKIISLNALNNSLEGGNNPLLGGKVIVKDIIIVKEEDNNKIKKTAFPIFGKQDEVKLKWNDLKAKLPETTKELKTALADFITGNKPEFLEPYAYTWNIFANENDLPQIEASTDERTKKIKIRAKEKAFEFIKILEGIRKSRFLKGDNDRTWKVDFNYLIENDSNYLQILEGKYK